MLLALLIAALPPQEAQARPQPVAGDLRSQRPWVISAEAGWNGLAGVGAVVARHLLPHFTVEAGVGGSGEGAKIGFRGRYNLSLQEWTPFVGAGFLYGTGTRGQRNGTPYVVGPSPFLQLTCGLEYQSRAGLNALFAVGYARLLQQNLTAAGSGSLKSIAGEDVFSGGGLVASVSLGYAF
jgi:hypothetical protein